MATIYKINKTEFLSPRPRWIVRVLLDISPSEFVKPDRKSAQVVLDRIESRINESGELNIRRRYKVLRSEESVSIVNDRNKPIVSFQIKPCNVSIVDHE